MEVINFRESIWTEKQFEKSHKIADILFNYEVHRCLAPDEFDAIVAELVEILE